MNPNKPPAIQRLSRTVLAAALLLLASPAWSATQERPDAEMRQTLLEAINSSDSFQDRFDAEVWLTDMSNRMGKRIKNSEERL
ncbi:MAG: lytic transglycosylase domain-containing protein, partial [Gammaproteobacteria bacterium]|nr:lytic transglycosylase domain-containing protein [Gammaproteobacteria bacterium]